MPSRYRTLSALGATLTLNALRPLPGSSRLSIPSFFASWLTAELAPQNLAATVAGTSAHVARHGVRTRGDRIALACNAFSAAGLAHIIRQSLRTRDLVEDSLRAGLGADYAAHLDPAPGEDDLATPWRQVLMPFRMSHPDVEVLRDVQYGPARRLRLDVYRPRGPRSGARRPVLLQLHGGAWTIGEKEHQGIPLMMHLAARGWVCVAPNYQLSPRVQWPQHLVDVKRSLAWIRREIGRYGGAPEFVAVTGGSAGGHLAAMVALTPNEPRYQPGFDDVDTSVQACVPHYGVYDLVNSLGSRPGEIRMERLLVPYVFRHRDELPYRDASPLLLVQPDAPPFFVIHGTNDGLVPVEEARAFVGSLRAKAREPVVYAELPGTQHAFDVFPSIRSAHVVRGVERFLRHVHRTARLAGQTDSLPQVVAGEL